MCRGGTDSNALWRWNTPCFILAEVFAIVMFLLSALDIFNTYTVPLQAWLVLVWIADVFFMLVVGRNGLWMHVNLSSSKTVEKKPMTAGAVPESLTRDRKALASVSLLFWLASFVLFLWLAMQITFLWDYVRNKDGAEAALDQGFPTDSELGTNFAAMKKLFFLYSVQVGTVVQTLLFAQVLHAHVIHKLPYSN